MNLQTMNNILFCILNVLDLMTTYIGFLIGNQEINPFIKYFISYFSNVLFGLIGFKVIMVVAYFYIFNNYSRIEMTGLLNIFLGLICFWNMLMIFHTLHQIL